MLSMGVFQTDAAYGIVKFEMMGPAVKYVVKQYRCDPSWSNKQIHAFDICISMTLLHI